MTEKLDDLVRQYRDDLGASVDSKELSRLRAEEQRLMRKKDEARERELHADDAEDKRYYAGQFAEFKEQPALLRRRIISFSEEADAVEVDTAAIRNEARAAWKTSVRSERRELIVGWIAGIDWHDDEVVITLRVPLKTVTRGRYIAWINPVLGNYKLEQMEPMFREIDETLMRIPGVRMVAPALYAPMTGVSWNEGVRIEGRPEPAATEDTGAAWARVMPGFFESIGAKVMAGRFITDRDTGAGRKVAVVNQAFAAEIL
jgi:hypothetical protein